MVPTSRDPSMVSVPSAPYVVGNRRIELRVFCSQSRWVAISLVPD